MPFGLIFGALVLGLLGPWFGIRFLDVPWGPARAAGILLVTLGLSLALGLVLRQPWARWLGVFTSLVLAVLGVIQIRYSGTILDFLILFAASSTFVLLLVPATGDVKRGLGPEALLNRKRRRGMAGVACGSILGLAAVGAWATVAPAPELRATLHDSLTSHRVSWLDFASGIEMAKSENKRVLVDFYATWCQPCRMMDKKTFRDASVVERLSDFVVVRVDTEEEIVRGGVRGVDLAEEYRVMSYPTVMLLDGEGRELSRKTGYLGPRAFLEWLDSASGRAEPLLADKAPVSN